MIICLASHLTLDNLDEVCSALSDVCESDKWKQIGTLLLNVPTDTFDQQPVGSLKDILQTWLISKTESTWEKLADTLNVVGEAELARKLKNMYCEGKYCPLSRILFNTSTDVVFALGEPELE